MTTLSTTQPHYSVIPLVSQLEAYTRFVNSIPLLSVQEEQECLKKWEHAKDKEAAKKLVMSHLRLVVSIAKKYEGYGLPKEDLIQEGNVGLMKAVKNFNASFGVRLVSYAMVWVKAEMQDYILNNWKLVKLGTTKGLKKLFFNFRQKMNELEESVEGRANSVEKAKKVLQDLNVREDELQLAQEWFAQKELPLYIDGDDGMEVFELADSSVSVDKRLTHEKQDKIVHALMDTVAGRLTEKEQYVLKSRYQEDVPLKLHEIAERLGCSAERVRQIEKEVLIKMKNMLQQQGIRKEDLLLESYE